MKNAEDSSLKINVRLIRKIQRAITKWPENYNQFDFGRFFRFNAKKQKEPDCGSACCIAGWACALEGYEPAKLERNCRAPRVFRKAMELLGLTYKQADELFSGHKATPKRAVKALDRLIATGGKRSW